MSMVVNFKQSNKLPMLGCTNPVLAKPYHNPISSTWDTMPLSQPYILHMPYHTTTIILFYIQAMPYHTTTPYPVHAILYHNHNPISCTCHTIPQPQPFILYLPYYTTAKTSCTCHTMPQPHSYITYKPYHTTTLHPVHAILCHNHNNISCICHTTPQPQHHVHAILCDNHISCTCHSIPQPQSCTCHIIPQLQFYFVYMP